MRTTYASAAQAELERGCFGGVALVADTVAALSLLSMDRGSVVISGGRLSVCSHCLHLVVCRDNGAESIPGTILRQ